MLGTFSALLELFLETFLARAFPGLVQEGYGPNVDFPGSGLKIEVFVDIPELGHLRKTQEGERGGEMAEIEGGKSEES